MKTRTLYTPVYVSAPRLANALQALRAKPVHIVTVSARRSRVCLNIWTLAVEEPLSSHDDEVVVVLMSSSACSLARDDSRSCSL